MSRVHRYASIIAVLASTTVMPVAGQQSAGGPHGRSRVPAVVVMLDSTLAEPGYRILRRNGGGPDDVIVLGSDVDPSTFSAAVRHLVLVRRATGDTASASGEVRVRHNPEQQHDLVAPLPWAERILGDLRRADRREVPNLGRERMLRIWLPAQRRLAAR